MTTLQTVVACIALGACAAFAAIAVAYPAWRDRQRAIGYDYGKTDHRRDGYLAGALDTVLLTPALDQHADEALALVATPHLGQITGSTAFGEALLNAELRQGLHEGGVFPWQRQAADGQVVS